MRIQLRKQIGLIAALVLMIMPMLGCGLLDRVMNPPSLTSQQAIVLIQVAGVPYIDDYFTETVGEEEAQATSRIGPATTMPGWSASYEGDGEWKIQGPVSTNSWGECLTIWTLSETDSKIHLVGFNCD